MLLEVNMPQILIPILCVLSIIAAAIILFVQWNNSKKYDQLVLGTFRFRFFTTPNPNEMSLIYNQCARMLDYINTSSAVEAEKEAWRQIIIEVYPIGMLMSSVFFRGDDSHLAGTLDVRSFLLGASKQVVIMVRLVNGRVDILHEFAYHAVSYIRYKDPNGEGNGADQSEFDIIYNKLIKG